MLSASRSVLVEQENIEINRVPRRTSRRTTRRLGKLIQHNNNIINERERECAAKERERGANYLIISVSIRLERGRGRRRDRRSSAGTTQCGRAGGKHTLAGRGAARPCCFG